MSGGDWKDLFSGATRGDLELVRYHISNGVDQNYQHPEILSTPLVTAIIYGHTEVAVFLINAGADLNLVSYYENMTPVQAALKTNNSVVLEELSKHGVSHWRLFIRRFWTR